MQQLLKHLNLEEASKALVNQRHGKGLRPTAPKGDLNLFLWRMMSYHVGYVAKPPTHAVDDLQGWFKNNTTSNVDLTSYSEEKWQVMEVFLKFIKELHDHMGLKMYFRKDWHKRLLYYNR